MFHVYYFDTEAGEALCGKTQQGYSDDSCWARGQAWGIYDFTLSCLYAGDSSFLETAKNIADYSIQELPENKICYWNLIFNERNEEERDSSSVVIAACGLLELSRQLPLNDEKHGYYEKVALELLRALAEKYTTVLQPESNDSLLHGVYDKKTNTGIDKCMIWGDYSYSETLTYLTKSWHPFWQLMGEDS